MKITKSEIRMLLDLYISVEGLTPYTFYQRYKFSPVQVYQFTERFEKKNYIESKDGKIYITKEGQSFIDQNRFNFDKNKFSRVPEEFIVPRLKVNEPYIPNIEILSNEILTLKVKKGDD